MRTFFVICAIVLTLGLSMPALGRSCSITSAATDLETSPPTLTLDGQLCTRAGVWIGTSGGTLKELPLLVAGETRLIANLSGHTEPGGRIVVVECFTNPKTACSMDVWPAHAPAPYDGRRCAGGDVA